MTRAQQIEAVEIKGEDLDALGEKIRKHVKASRDAAQSFVEHAMAAGDALICAKDQVRRSGCGWLKWLKSCDLREDTAERYMRLARHRAELDSARVRNLSLTAALKLISKSPSTNAPTAIVTKPTSKATSFDALGWWSNADHQARQHFLDNVGLRGILDAAPTAWCDELKRELCKSPPPVIKSEVVVTPPAALLTEREPLDPSDPGPIPDFLLREKSGATAAMPLTFAQQTEERRVVRQAERAVERAWIRAPRHLTCDSPEAKAPTWSPIGTRVEHPLNKAKRQARAAAREDFRQRVAWEKAEQEAREVPLPPHITRMRAS
jgi:hypothetical protein